MNNNRYAPPVAEVREFAEEAPARPPRPRQVVWAVRLLWATTALSIPGIYAELARAPSTRAMIGGLAAEAVAIAFVCFLYVGIHRGRNWARVVTLLFTILSTALVIFGPALPGRSRFDQFFTVLNTACDIACMILLYTSASSRFFKPRSGPVQ